MHVAASHVCVGVNLDKLNLVVIDINNWMTQVTPIRHVCTVPAHTPTYTYTHSQQHLCIDLKSLSLLLKQKCAVTHLKHCFGNKVQSVFSSGASSQSINKRHVCVMELVKCAGPTLLWSQSVWSCSFRFVLSVRLIHRETSSQGMSVPTNTDPRSDLSHSEGAHPSQTAVLQPAAVTSYASPVWSDVSFSWSEMSSSAGGRARSKKPHWGNRISQLVEFLIIKLPQGVLRIVDDVCTFHMANVRMARTSSPSNMAKMMTQSGTANDTSGVPHNTRVPICREKNCL